MAAERPLIRLNGNKCVQHWFAVPSGPSHCTRDEYIRPS